MNLTNRAELRRLCAHYGFRLNKGLGQHFLVNPGVCQKLCEAAGIGPESEVLEIGPGFGTLTQELGRRARRVVAIEVDRRLEGVLGETLRGFGNVSVEWGDVLKEDLAALLARHFTGPVTVCANLPYNITSPVIMRLLEGGLPLLGLTVMVQKEAAQRLAAPPGTRQAGAVTYAAHYYAAPVLCFLVQPGSFMPPPKVTSAVLTLTLRAPAPLAGQPQRRQRLFALIRAGFSKRRKTLANAAAGAQGLQKAQIETALTLLGHGPAARPEQLSLEDYIALEHALWP